MPVIPVVVIDTDNTHVYGHLKRLQRAPVTLRVGKAFRLTRQADRRETMRTGTRQIMDALANLLPETYRGVYRTVSD